MRLLLVYTNSVWPWRVKIKFLYTHWAILRQMNIWWPLNQCQIVAFTQLWQYHCFVCIVVQFLRLSDLQSSWPILLAVSIPTGWLVALRRFTADNKPSRKSNANERPKSWLAGWWEAWQPGRVSYWSEPRPDGLLWLPVAAYVTSATSQLPGVESTRNVHRWVHVYLHLGWSRNSHFKISRNTKFWRNYC